LALTVSPALSKQEGKMKGKGSEKRAAKDNSGRQAGELPSGLQRYMEKKGDLPSGLQTRKDEDGQLTRGLEKGGKKLSSTSKGKKIAQ
jgi:hypothetical protein